MFNYATTETIDKVFLLVKPDGRKVAIRLSELLYLEEGLDKNHSCINFMNGEQVIVNHKFTELYDLFFNKK
jgi:hypothetical protein